MRPFALFGFFVCSLFAGCHHVRDDSRQPFAPSVAQHPKRVYEVEADKIRHLKRTELVSEFVARVPRSQITVDRPVRGTARSPNARQIVVVSFVADGALIEANFTFDFEDSLIEVFFGRVCI